MEILKRKFSIKEINSKDIQIGDSVELPEFTVPETTIDGINKLHFDEQVIKDTATVYNIKDNKLYLVFDHALFRSAMDLNNARKWKDTQLCRYLKEHFEPAMRYKGIPVKKVSLLSKDKLFGDNPPPFFKNEKNRIAFDKDEDYSVWYWLKDIASSAYFCYAGSNGISLCNDASYASIFVRPCFVIQQS